jgi:hypothetical protein
MSIRFFNIQCKVKWNKDEAIYMSVLLTVNISDLGFLDCLYW